LGLGLGNAQHTSAVAAILLPNSDIKAVLIITILDLKLTIYCLYPGVESAK